jgi:hypothetical protein
MLFRSGCAKLDSHFEATHMAPTFSLVGYSGSRFCDCPLLHHSIVSFVAVTEQNLPLQALCVRHSDFVTLLEPAPAVTLGSVGRFRSAEDLSVPLETRRMLRTDFHSLEEDFAIKIRQRGCIRQAGPNEDPSNCGRSYLIALKLR